MPLIPEQLLDDIQSRADIAELIGQYVPLKRAGRNFKGRCPFHQERTPSFHVNTDKQIYHCFGCGVGGNIFSFLMQQERLTFPEAAQRLAEQVGVTLPSGGDAGRSERMSALADLMEKATQYYERMLAHPAMGRAARAYLDARGVAAATRQAYRLGCAPGGWQHLVDAARRRGIGPDQLETAGLALSGPRGFRDRFRDRLLFPIQDARGRVLSFGGRSLADQEPKYLNGPETPLYHKGQGLFGIAQAKDAIARAKCAVIVEGYFDCVVLWQEGVQHVVSPLGVALTPEQARLLARYADRAVLAFDPDTAGETASLRGIDVLVEAGFHVQVAQLPPGVDPDEFVRAYGREAMEQLLANAAGVVEFLMACAGKRYRLGSADEKVRAAEQMILPTVAKVPNAMLRAEYVRVLAEQWQLDEHAVREELGKAQSRPAVGRAAAAPAAPAARPTPGQSAERLVTALVLDEPSRWTQLQGRVALQDLQDERLRRILAVIAEVHGAGERQPSAGQVMARLQDEEAGALIPQLIALAQAEPTKDDAWNKGLKRLERDAGLRHQEQLRQQIRVAQERGNDAELMRLMGAYQLVMKSPTEAGVAQPSYAGTGRKP
ncbi:MAG: DNA primase [Candidatus Omnitrophica bacterium]|nr:DNA primase [Candidatus Omnitrophota bacterium]